MRMLHPNREHFEKKSGLGIKSRLEFAPGKSRDPSVRQLVWEPRWGRLGVFLFADRQEWQYGYA